MALAATTSRGARCPGSPAGERRQATGALTEGVRTRQRLGARSARARRQGGAARASRGWAELGGHGDREPARRGWSTSPGSFYRTSHGAEINLVLEWPTGEEWAVEIKRSLAPTLERGFHSALADLAPQRALVVHPAADSYRLSSSVEAIGLAELCAQAHARSCQ